MASNNNISMAKNGIIGSGMKWQGENGGERKRQHGEIKQ
jgi:hypothetical protein